MRSCSSYKILQGARAQAFHFLSDEHFLLPRHFICIHHLNETSGLCSLKLMVVSPKTCFLILAILDVCLLSRDSFPPTLGPGWSSSSHIKISCLSILSSGLASHVSQMASRPGCQMTPR